MLFAVPGCCRVGDGGTEHARQLIAHRLLARGVAPRDVALDARRDAPATRERQPQASESTRSGRPPPPPAIPAQRAAEARTAARRRAPRPARRAETRDVELQRLDGRVALRRLFAQRLRDDRVEIASQRARRQPVRSVCAAAAALAGGAVRCSSVRRACTIGTPQSGQGCVPVSSSNSSRPSAYVSVAVVTGRRRSARARRTVGVSGACVQIVTARALSARAASRRRSRAASPAPSARHEDVRGLEVAMHDQVAVRIGDGLADLRTNMFRRCSSVA